MSARLRLGIVRDFRAEGWPSMDLCADQLSAHLPSAASTIVAEDLEFPFRRFFGGLPLLGRTTAFNADRVLNRHLLLPSSLGRVRRRYDWFHIADHSYAHLVHFLPPGRTGVYCHDLDAFRCLLEPESEPRPWWFRQLTRGILHGLQAAAKVFHNSREVGIRLVRAGIVSADKLVHSPLGVSDEFTPGPRIDRRNSGDESFLLHVGTNIPRKRLDLLLDVFAAVRKCHPGLRLLQVGGPWTSALAEQIERLKIGPAVTQVRNLSREQLADLYRKAVAVLVTSDAEGFGLPVIEALACGAIVVASDLPVIREVGGSAVVLARRSDAGSWVDAVTRALADPASAPSRDNRLRQAAKFTWSEHARVIGETYVGLAAIVSNRAVESPVARYGSQRERERMGMSMQPSGATKGEC